ncbi:heme-binding protein 2-like [Macrobrachium rosenbergii]|uniref:heme-binding protein 2-like n=1 Tax=Macrobrachium rosenbergii TaxID=79674 RepID=UPI0034D44DB7
MSSIIKGIKAAFGDVEMTPYEVLVERGGYEERRYPGKKWVCTSATGMEYNELISPMFRKLFNYISGRNEPNVRIDMTSPVTTFVEPGAGPTCESTFTMGFLIPEEHQADPPPSGDNSIFIEERPAMVVLTRRFGGYASDEIIIKEAKELAEEIQRQNEPGVNYNQYYIAGYDPPFKLFGRRNEIWFVKTTTQDINEADSSKQMEISSVESKDLIKNGDVIADSIQSKVEEALGHQIDKKVEEE